MSGVFYCLHCVQRAPTTQKEVGRLLRREPVVAPVVIESPPGRRLLPARRSSSSFPPSASSALLMIRVVSPVRLTASPSVVVAPHEHLRRARAPFSGKTQRCEAKKKNQTTRMNKVDYEYLYLYLVLVHCHCCQAQIFNHPFIVRREKNPKRAPPPATTRAIINHQHISEQFLLDLKNTTTRFRSRTCRRTVLVVVEAPLPETFVYARVCTLPSASRGTGRGPPSLGARDWPSRVAPAAHRRVEPSTPGGRLMPLDVLGHDDPSDIIPRYHDPSAAVGDAATEGDAEAFAPLGGDDPGDLQTSRPGMTTTRPRRGSTGSAPGMFEAETTSSERTTMGDDGGTTGSGLGTSLDAGAATDWLSIFQEAEGGGAEETGRRGRRRRARRGSTGGGETGRSDLGAVRSSLRCQGHEICVEDVEREEREETVRARAIQSNLSFARPASESGHLALCCACSLFSRTSYPPHLVSSGDHLRSASKRLRAAHPRSSPRMNSSTP